MSLIKKLFGGGKPGYFLELKEEDIKSSTVAEEKKPAAAKTETPEAEVKKPAAAKTQPEAEVKKPVAATKETVKVAPTPEAKPSPSVVEPAKVVPQVGLTFAPKYLIQANTANSRRLPGANMNSFLDMARQVKTGNG